MVRRVLTWFGVAFLIWFIAFQPSGAASVFGSAFRFLGNLARGFGDFFTRLVA